MTDELKKGDYVRVIVLSFLPGRDRIFLGKITYIYFKSMPEHYRKFVVSTTKGIVDIFGRNDLEKISEEEFLLESL